MPSEEQAVTDTATPGSTTIPERLLGAWRLIEFSMRDAQGQPAPRLGERARGLLMLDACGYASAQLMFANHPTLSAEARSDPARAAYGGYTAYYGPVSIDERAATLVTHVESALDPAWVGTDQLRHYGFEGDRLVLRAPGVRIRGVEYQGRFVWTKVA
jgi:hypothetical protein